MNCKGCDGDGSCFSSDECIRPKIMMAAVLQDGVVYTGKRHSDVFRSMMATGIGIKSNSEKVQGFITNENKFVNRNEAAKIAFENGRIEKSKELLFSEDLY